MLREPLKIHFGEQANLFDSGRRQEKGTLASAKADLPSLPEYKNLLLVAQKQLLELPSVEKANEFKMNRSLAKSGCAYRVDFRGFDPVRCQFFAKCCRIRF